MDIFRLAAGSNPSWMLKNAEAQQQLNVLERRVNLYGTLLIHPAKIAGCLGRTCGTIFEVSYGQGVNSIEKTAYLKPATPLILIIGLSLVASIVLWGCILSQLVHGTGLCQFGLSQRGKRLIRAICSTSTKPSMKEELPTKELLGQEAKVTSHSANHTDKSTPTTSFVGHLLEQTKEKLSFFKRDASTLRNTLIEDISVAEEETHKTPPPKFSRSEVNSAGHTVGLGSTEDVTSQNPARDVPVQGSEGDVSVQNTEETS